MSNCSYCNGTGHLTVKNASGVAEFGGICTVCGGSGLQPGTRYISSINECSSIATQKETHRVVEASSGGADNMFSLVVGALAGIFLFLFLGGEVKGLFVGFDAAGFYLPAMAVIVIAPILFARFVPHAAKFIALALIGVAILYLFRVLQ